MATDFYIKENDTSPSLIATLRNADRTVIVLSTDDAVKFHMRREKDNALKVDSTGVTILSATGGRVQYDWSTGDTDTAGEWLGEFEITSAGGAVATVPNSCDIPIHIRRELD